MRHACTPFIEPFFTAEAPVDRLLAILGEIVHNPCRHEDVAVPAILVFEDIMRMHSTPRWNDVVLFEQCLQVHVEPFVEFELGVGSAFRQLPSPVLNPSHAFVEIRGRQCEKPARSKI